MKIALESLYAWYRQMLSHPRYRWWVVVGSLAYLLSPIDFLPDMFPILGFIDDGLIATLLVTEISQMVLSRLKGKKTSPEMETPTVEVDVMS